MANEKELQQLLNTAAQRLGTSPQALRQGAQNGDLSKLLGNVNPNDAKKLEQVLNDPKAAEKLLSTPQAQELMKKFL